MKNDLKETWQSIIYISHGYEIFEIADEITVLRTESGCDKAKTTWINTVISLMVGELSESFPKEDVLLARRFWK